MRKRILSVALAMLSVLLVAGCGIFGSKVLKYEDFKTYLSEPIEITTENWDEYFDVYVYEASRDDTIPSAEIILLPKDGYIIDPNDNPPCIYLNDGMFFFDDSISDSMLIYNYYDLVCQEASGCVRKESVPDEEWSEAPEGGYELLNVKMEDRTDDIFYRGEYIRSVWDEGSYILHEDLVRPDDLPYYVRMPDNAQTFHYTPKFGDFAMFDLVYDADKVSPVSLDSWTYGWLAEDPQNQEEPSASFYVFYGNYEEFYQDEFDKYNTGKMWTNVQVTEPVETRINAYNGYYWTLTFDVKGTDMTSLVHYYAIQLDEEHYFYITVGDSYLDGRMAPEEFFKHFIYDIVVY